MRLSPPAKRKEYRDHHTSWISSTEALLRRMVYGERINELLEHTDVDANPDVDYYNHADKLDSVMVMAENDGDIAESYRYKEFGEQTVVDSSFAKLSVYVSSIGNYKRYTGQEHALPSSFGDPWLFYRARVYRADAGRFVQRDLRRYVDGSGMYTYVKNSPLKYVDPTGTRAGGDLALLAHLLECCYEGDPDCCDLLWDLLTPPPPPPPPDPWQVCYDDCYENWAGPCGAITVPVGLLFLISATGTAIADMWPFAGPPTAFEETTAATAYLVQVQWESCCAKHCNETVGRH